MLSAALSLAAGLVVGIGYGLCGIRSPAPPAVALLGLLGMLAGERGVVLAVRLVGDQLHTATASGARTAIRGPHVQDTGRMNPPVAAARRPQLCRARWFFGAAMSGEAHLAGSTLALEVAQGGGFERDLEVQTGNVSWVRAARSGRPMATGSSENSRNRRFGAGPAPTPSGVADPHSAN